jgi:dTDP-4-amino-4,6-dideoxygalactose transaminase
MIPFAPPYIDEDVICEVTDSLRSGWITTGPKVKALEEKVAEYCGVEKALCVNSATSALIFMLNWFGIKKGDEVIVPSYTYCSTALSVLHLGASPVMVDIGEDFNINVRNIRNAITEKTKAIIPVDIAGYPCDYDEIFEIINDPEIKKLFTPQSDYQEKLGRILLLADSAHSFGANYKGKRTGSIADVTIFSFHAVKNLTTAEGGAIVFNLPKPINNENLYTELRPLTLNGQTKDAFTKTVGNSWKYDVERLGYKINMPDVCAAIGLAQFSKYDTILDRRRQIFKYYKDKFSEYDWAITPPFSNEKKGSSCHVYLLRLTGISETQRDQIISEMYERGVSVNVHFVPLPMLTLFKNLNYDIEEFPVSKETFLREISLPIYPQLTDNQLEMITSTLINVYNSIIKK